MSTFFEGLPVLIDYSGPLHTFQGGMSPGSRGGVLQGGQSIFCAERGTTFAILQGVNDPSKKYLVTSSHVVQGKSCQCSGCRPYKDARPCNQKVYLDAAAVGPLTGRSSPNIIGMNGPPKGFKKPQKGVNYL